MAFKRSGVRFPSPPLGRRNVQLVMRRRSDAGIAQLVEHNLAKVGVAGSSPVSRSVSIVLDERLLVVSPSEAERRQHAGAFQAAAELGG